MRSWPTFHGFLSLAAFLVGLSYWGTPPSDPDLGWHLLGGRWIADHRAVPETDFINAFNGRWHDYHWLAQLFMYGAYALGGYDTVAILYGVVMALLHKTIMDIALQGTPQGKPWRVGDLIPPLIAFGASAGLLANVASIRPQIAALLVMALALRRLEKPPGGYELPTLFAGTVLVVNMHVYWVFLPLLWGIYRCLPRCDLLAWRGVMPSRGYSWGGLALLSAAGLVSPYGWFSSKRSLPTVLMNYGLIYEYMQIPSIVRSTVGEFRSTIVAGDQGTWIYLGVAAGFLVTLSTRRIRESPLSFITTAIGFTLAWNARKYLGVFALLMVPALRSMRTIELLISLVMRRVPHANTLRQVEVQKIWGALPVVAALVVCATTFPLASSQRSGVETRWGAGMCKAFAQSPPPRSGEAPLRILTHFDDGGWCAWTINQTSPGLAARVTTDNRTQGVPGSHYEESLDLYAVRNGWLRTLASWKPDAAVVAKFMPLAQFLLLDTTHWRLVAQDDTYALFYARATYELPNDNQPLHQSSQN